MHVRRPAASPFGHDAQHQAHCDGKVLQLHHTRQPRHQVTGTETSSTCDSKFANRGVIFLLTPQLVFFIVILCMAVCICVIACTSITRRKFVCARRSDCEEIWRAFEEAVLRQASCDVAAEHYRHMFRAMPQTGACDRVTHKIPHSHSRQWRLICQACVLDLNINFPDFFFTFGKIGLVMFYFRSMLLKRNYTEVCLRSFTETNIVFYQLVASWHQRTMWK